MTQKCDAKAVEDIDGVKGVFSASGQLQIILGTGTVNKVYDEFLAISGMSGMSKEEAKEAAAQKQPLFTSGQSRRLGDIFVPIIPAIVASGFLMGIMEALDLYGKQRLCEYRHLRFSVYPCQSVCEHSLYLPSDSHCLQCGQGIWRKSLSWARSSV